MKLMTERQPAMVTTRMIVAKVMNEATVANIAAVAVAVTAA